MKGIGLLRRALRRRPANTTNAAFAVSIHWSARSMRRALNEQKRIPPHVIATLTRMEEELKRGRSRKVR